MMGNGKTYPTIRLRATGGRFRRQIVRRGGALGLAQFNLLVNIGGYAGWDARCFLQRHLLLVCLRSLVMFSGLTLDFGGDQSVENVEVLSSILSYRACSLI